MCGPNDIRILFSKVRNYMKWLDRWIQRAYNRARERDEIMPIEVTSRRGRGTPITQLSANKRVASSYDDEQVYNFTVYGANGGKIVEVVRYDEKHDREKVHRYVIGEGENLSDSLGKIVTMEYLR